MSSRTGAMIQARSGVLTAALIAACAAGAAGCQQPIRCGAVGEPCCEVDGAFGCLAPLSCSLGTCGISAASSCPVAGGACDIGLQNCGAGASCQVSGSTTVCEASGGGVEGNPCVGPGDCRPGHYCSGLAGVCHRYCCGDDAACEPYQLCVPSGRGSVGFCVGEPCDPLTAAGCAPGAGCYLITGRDGNLSTVCLPAGSSGVGGPCSALDDCASGLACTTADVCRALCRPSVGCAGTCTPIDGIEDLGLCS
jgi:hypothetical protein